MSRSSEVARLSGLLVKQLRCPVFGNNAPLGSLASSPRFVHKNSKDGKVLHPELLNDAVLKTQYAVRGELYLRAEELRKEGKEIIFTNGQYGYRYIRLFACGYTVYVCLLCPYLPLISSSAVGNPHALGAKPMTFPRQVRGRGRECPLTSFLTMTTHPHGVHVPL